MDTMHRRTFLRGLVGGAVAVAAAGSGVALLTETAEAAPVAAAKTMPPASDAPLENPLEKVQYYYRRRYYPYYRRRYYPYYRRRRYWRCWWVRGRRVCGWRY